VGQLWRNSGYSLSGLQQPQLPRPIGKREAETVPVGIARQDFRFDDRDLAATAIDSR
jgi:hypothetical protein